MQVDPANSPKPLSSLNTYNSVITQAPKSPISDKATQVLKDKALLEAQKAAAKTEAEWIAKREFCVKDMMENEGLTREQAETKFHILLD